MFKQKLRPEFHKRSGTIGAFLQELEPEPMTETNFRTLEKLCVVWSSRLERNIALRVSYCIHRLDGCKVFNLNQIQILEYYDGTK